MVPTPMPMAAVAMFIVVPFTSMLSADMPGTCEPAARNTPRSSMRMPQTSSRMDMTFNAFWEPDMIFSSLSDTSTRRCASRWKL